MNEREKKEIFVIQSAYTDGTRSSEEYWLNNDIDQ